MSDLTQPERLTNLEVRMLCFCYALMSQLQEHTADLTRESLEVESADIDELIDNSSRHAKVLEIGEKITERAAELASLGGLNEADLEKIQALAIETRLGGLPDLWKLI